MKSGDRMNASPEVIDVAKSIYVTTQRLEKASNELFRLGREKAEMERSYREALAKELLQLRMDKMPASLIGDIARGNLSELKFKRDLAQEVFKSALSAVEAIKTQVSALQSILKHYENIS
jgi:hypothetical protein